MSAIGMSSIYKPGQVSVIVIQRAFAHGRSFLNLPILGCSSEGDSGNQTQAFALLQGVESAKRVDSAHSAAREGSGAVYFSQQY